MRAAVYRYARAQAVGLRTTLRVIINGEAIPASSSGIQHDIIWIIYFMTQSLSYLNPCVDQMLGAENTTLYSVVGFLKLSQQRHKQ